MEYAAYGCINLLWQWDKQGKTLVGNEHAVAPAPDAQPQFGSSTASLEESHRV